MSTPDLHSRIQRLLDGEISAAEFAALDAELLENPEALEIYRGFVRLHCGLQAHHEFRRNVLRMPVVPVDRVIALQRRHAIKTSLLAAAALFVLLGTVMWWVTPPDRPVSFASFQIAPDSAFTLTYTGDGKPPKGNQLAAGSRIVLDHGVAEFNLPHDVRAIVEAPATLTIIDDRSVNLDRGRAFFEVQSPDGHGFTVITPNQKIVDLGTAFGVDLPVGSDQTHLHVFTGSVRIEGLDGLDGKETGEVIRAPMSVAIRGIRVVEQLDEPADRFRRQLPERVERIFVEDFESGLLAEKDYAIHMDQTAIRDQAGNCFAGIFEKNPWRFSTSKELRIRNPGFETPTSKGGLIPHWPEVAGAQISAYKAGPKPTEGDRHLLLLPDRTVVQDLYAPIRAGTTYTLTLDIGNESSNSNSLAIVSFFGSVAGYQKPLAEIRVDPPPGGWLHSRILSYTATTEDATGQTLGIALSAKNNWVTFDDLRILETHDVDPAQSPGSLAEESGPSGQPDTTPPLISNFNPEPDSSNCPFDDIPTLVFDEPVRFGTGRIMIRNLTDDSEAELIVGSEHTSLRGRVLTFLPQFTLEDGASLNGGIPGWESSGPVSRFNPDGKGHRYRHPDLADDTKARGVLDSMKGPTLVSLGMRGQPGSIRRSLGNVDKGRTYTVSVGIGCRSSDAADKSPFAGYRIRLLCDSVVLNEISGVTPPGPPNSVTPVGFSWDSREFPDHLAADKPLVLEISSLGDANDDGGSLDLDHVQVTSLGGGER